MARRKRSSGGGMGIIVILAIAAAVFLAPAILVIKFFGIGPPQKEAFDIALNSSAAWIGSGAFWLVAYFIYQSQGEAPAAVHEQKQRLSSSGEKKCPACAELIKMEAKKCRYCGENLVAWGA